MKQVVRVIRVGALQWIAIAILGASMFSASKRAVLPAIGAILRVIWPFLVVYLIWRVIKAKVSGAVQKFQEQMLQQAQGAGAGGVGRQKNGGQVLDLCPKCGDLLGAGHRCSR